MIKHFVDLLVRPGLSQGLGRAEPGRVRGAVQFRPLIHKLAPQLDHLAHDCAPRVAGKFGAEFLMFLYGVFAQ